MSTTKDDLAQIQADLNAIRANGSTGVAALQAQIKDQQTQIDALKAGDVVTAQQATDLNTSADAVAASADALAALFPPAPLA